MTTETLKRAGIVTRKSKTAIPLYIASGTIDASFSKADKNWLKQSGFKPKSGNAALIPGRDGAIKKAIVGVDSDADYYGFAESFAKLPAKTFQFHEKTQHDLWRAFFIGLDNYRFTAFKPAAAKQPQLVVASKKEQHIVENMLAAHFQVRDLINYPAESMGPDDIASQIKELADAFGGKFSAVKGDALLKKNFPLIHAVGRASHRPPQLVELRWGKKTDPLVSIVGKGVCYDTGGLNLKPGQYMRNMKKDMGGAAHAIGLARWLIASELPIQVQLLVPTVDNAVAGNAFRPGDVFSSRAGLTVEIDNTDAEGRLVLADALCYAGESDPEIIIDFATLTGAARVALGTDIPVFFTNNESHRQLLFACAPDEQETVWPLPLHAPYNDKLKSSIADLANAAKEPYGGAITAALFLQHFVKPNVDWIHFDVMAYNTSKSAARPEGGEAMGLRSAYRFICELFSEEA